MEEQSKLAERILEQVADAVISTDRSGAIIRWNHASAALFGYSAGEVLLQSVELIIPEHLRTAHWTGFDAAMYLKESRVVARGVGTERNTRGGGAGVGSSGRRDDPRCNGCTGKHAEREHHGFDNQLRRVARWPRGIIVG